MPTAAIYDLHGNLPALEAVLASCRARGVDRIVVGGDVLPGPLANACLARLRALDCEVHFLRGNGEREVLAERAGQPARVPAQYREVMRWAAQQLDDAQAAWLATWPPTVRLAEAGLGEVLFCHATPRRDDELVTIRTEERHLAPVFAASGASLVVCGHTHMQFDRHAASVRIVNAGSAGMPFGRPGADWLLLDGIVRLQHTDYDLDSAAARIRASDYPDREAFAADHVLRPPTAEAMLAVFHAAERWPS